MGRPPCCDKAGVKKGPWTPEEDIMLVSYVQEHGPGNWRAVPATTGLMRCSKSCRLRWTNYLRPGIKRGSFTDHEEKMIIQLQALLGNKWAAIASYLPERTDNDIKNYWNTHLKKKIRKMQTGSGHQIPDPKTNHPHSISRGQWERRLQADITTAKQALKDALSFETSSESVTVVTDSDVGPGRFSYASSTENISRLLKNWVKSTPKCEEYNYNNYNNNSKCSSTSQNSSSSNNNATTTFDSCLSEETKAYESLLFGSNCSREVSRSVSPRVCVDVKPDPDELGPLSAIESWLFDDHQGKDYMSSFLFDHDLF